MKKVILLLVVLVVGIYFLGCTKKRQSLEELQQPMSPEDLNRLSSQTEIIPSEEGDLDLVDQPASIEMVPVESSPAEEIELDEEPLPPPGPYKPTAKEIQAALQNAGYYTGRIDGKIGPKSKKAIKDFQRDNGLVVDGKVGPKTWGVLGKHLLPEKENNP